MNKVLLVHHCLRVGGGEKLTYELAIFALQNNFQPIILIPDNYSEEYYDSIFKQMNVSVIRTRLNGIRKLRNPKNILKALYWKYRLRNSERDYSAIHIINLHTAENVERFIKHKKRYFWHVGSAIQYPGNKLPITSDLFKNYNDTVVYIHPQQKEEIEKQYGNINCKTLIFKLFINS